MLFLGVSIYVLCRRLMAHNVQEQGALREALTAPCTQELKEEQEESGASLAPSSGGVLDDSNPFHGGPEAPVWGTGDAAAEGGAGLAKAMAVDDPALVGGEPVPAAGEGGEERGSAARPSGPTVEPFNMWSVQEQVDRGHALSLMVLSYTYIGISISIISIHWTRHLNGAQLHNYGIS